MIRESFIPIITSIGSHRPAGICGRCKRCYAARSSSNKSEPIPCKCVEARSAIKRRCFARSVCPSPTISIRISCHRSKRFASQPTSGKSMPSPRPLFQHRFQDNERIRSGPLSCAPRHRAPNHCAASALPMRGSISRRRRRGSKPS